VTGARYTLEVSALRALEPGESFTGGGGAWATWTVAREDGASDDVQRALGTDECRWCDGLGTVTGPVEQ
jgi:hypothetical protein